MNCLRCGKEIENEQVFCETCLADMEQQPVKPGTPIHLPRRDSRVNVKRANFRLAASKWQDRIFRLKYTIFWLIIIIVILLAFLALSVCMLLGLTPEWFNEMFFNDPAIQNIIKNANP